ncbi:transcription factor Tfb2 [Gregarina niphandrodes]|uniref:General transcription factor IIH subunit 4 n=1 Tax=Gregarina niphandrodes TaxID=110365 RepID=A0A023B665_GRENI|nr:transcription factor Tfb2 [Gregarina niphandrodes]EZG63419.1 transcription factor Tfb2 [Gregarina niphandrodes]|eukprot:XP_011130681.1 transcription factor Tfb2 [Gregarina niphandrodes]
MDAPIVRHIKKVLSGTSQDLVIGAMFGTPAIVKFVLTALTPESQCLVSRMTTISDPSRWEPLMVWFKTSLGAQRTQILRTALTQCRQLKVVKVVDLAQPAQAPVRPGGRVQAPPPPAAPGIKKRSGGLAAVSRASGGTGSNGPGPVVAGSHTSAATQSQVSRLSRPGGLTRSNLSVTSGPGAGGPGAGGPGAGGPGSNVGGSSLGGSNMAGSGGSNVGGSQLGTSQVAGKNDAGRIRYEVHPQFRQSYLWLVSDKRVLAHPTFRWLRLPSLEEAKHLATGPDAASLESFSRHKWAGMLLWAFKQSATQSPVLRYFPIVQVPPPGDLLRNIMISAGLAHEQVQRFAGIQIGEEAAASDVRWFLSDLPTQVDDIVMGALTQLALGQHVSVEVPAIAARTSGGGAGGGVGTMSATGFLSGDVPLMVLLAQVAANKIGEPILVSEDAPPFVNDFVSALHDIGLIYSAAVTLQGRSYRSVVPCPLARVFAINPATNGSELWLLSQLYGADSLQHTPIQSRTLALPRQRYSACCSPSLFQDSANSLEFLWTLPSDPLQEMHIQMVKAEEEQRIANATAVSEPRSSAISATGTTAFTSVSSGLGTSGLGTSGLGTSGLGTSGLGTSGSDIKATTPKKKGVIVESNFRVFCYYPDALQACIIASICDVKMVTPILVVAMLTRESATRRLMEGLKAEQIIKFLSSHAHPLVVNKFLSQDRTAPKMVSLPENVHNQLILWEDQLSAVSQTNAVIFELSDSSELQLFPQLIYRAKSSGHLICSTPGPSTSSSAEVTFLATASQHCNTVLTFDPII